MAKYRAKTSGFLGRFIEAGETVTYSGEPGRWLEPLDQQARAAVEAMKRRRAERARKIAVGEIRDEVTNRFLSDQYDRGSRK